MAAIKGSSQSGFFPVKSRSINILLKTGLIIPIKDEIVVVRTTKTTAVEVPLSRSFAYSKTDFFFPEGVKSSPGSIVIQMPVNSLSNSSHERITWPLAGSFMTAFFPLKPHKTTKWLNPQCRIQGKGPSSRRSSGSSLQAFAIIP